MLIKKKSLWWSRFDWIALLSRDDEYQQCGIQPIQMVQRSKSPEICSVLRIKFNYRNSTQTVCWRIFQWENDLKTLICLEYQLHIAGSRGISAPIILFFCHSVLIQNIRWSLSYQWVYILMNINQLKSFFSNLLTI